MKLVRMPCMDFGSDVTGVNGQSFRHTRQVNVLLEIGGVPSMETFLVAPNLQYNFC